ncbi:FKBP-type peptidyl-prolyl cis-trans isomerase [Chryseolinea lacunae]|uniref:Peptidyl-prolyl cis-trans isomerase n=1 Tax=Chryseolinea lacunae TaxID=2801331 RepID=A0ABS1KVT7_9BACT|nr:FKBP-type peptidyl-prolyl cis-trans isomerase [Chryseolinea lacunae]MBL0743423.1 FKBP-type peptidyl-prolyl cis-trans isomerase [Chryseolinea lacunae]
MKKKLIGVGWAALTFVGLSFVLSSCLNSGDTYNSQLQLTQDVTAIDNFLSTNNISAVKDINGVRMVITKLGSGLPGQFTDSVDVDYVGKLFGSGATFDSGNTKGKVQNYIDGWKIALTTLPAGSEATLYIPSLWGYQNRTDLAKIPANSILVFDIKFNKVMVGGTQISQFKTDTTAINNYITTKAVANVVKDASGLRYVITSPGSGPIPSWYSKVKLKYSIKLLSDDTKVLATVEREPTVDSYSRVIDYIHGIKIGLQKMQTGSKATLYVPSGFAFGAQGAQDGSGSVIISPNTPLIIDIELVSIVN